MKIKEIYQILGVLLLKFDIGYSFEFGKPQHYYIFP